MASEFDLIRRFFDRPARAGGRTLLGVGDDHARLRVDWSEVPASDRADR